MAASAHSAVDCLAAAASGHSRGYSRLRTFKQFAQTRCVTLGCCDAPRSHGCAGCNPRPKAAAAAPTAGGTAAAAQFSEGACPAHLPLAEWTDGTGPWCC